MPPLIDGTVSTYGEPEATRAARVADWVLDNARLIVLVSILAVEVALCIGWTA